MTHAKPNPDIPTEAELVRMLAGILLRQLPPEPPLAVARRRALLDSPAYHFSREDRHALQAVQRRPAGEQADRRAG